MLPAVDKQDKRLVLSETELDRVFWMLFMFVVQQWLGWHTLSCGDICECVMAHAVSTVTVLYAVSLNLLVCVCDATRLCAKANHDNTHDTHSRTCVGMHIACVAMIQYCICWCCADCVRLLRQIEFHTVPDADRLPIRNTSNQLL